MPAKKAGGIRDACQESRVHVETFSACIRLFYALRKPPAGRVGAYRIRPPHAPVYGANTCSSCSNTVSSPFKHHSNVIQIRPCGPSVRGIRDASQAGRGHQGCLPSWPVTSNAYPAFFAGVRPLPRLGSLAGGIRDACQVGRVPQKPVPSKLRRPPQRPRGLGNDETSCLKLSEGSEMMKQVV